LTPLFEEIAMSFLSRSSALFGLGLLMTSTPGLNAADQAPEMRYGWKAGQTHVYNVTIEADYGDYVEKLTGHPTYQVMSADQDGIKLTVRGGLVESQQLKPGKRGILLRSPRMPFSPFTGVGSNRGMDLVINDRGDVASSKGNLQIPFLLGDLGQLMLEQLPKDAVKTWKTTRELNIVQGESGLPRPFARSDDRTVIKATLETSYSIDDSNENAIVLTRKVKLQTAELVGGKSRVEIDGEGKLTFDRKIGCFAKMEAQQKILQREANKIEETPLKISYRLLTDTEAKDLGKTAEGTLLFPNEALSEALQKQALEDLKSGDKLRLFKAMNMLGTKDPPKFDKEPTPLHKDIAKAIETILAGTDKTLRFSGAKALAKWATNDSLPYLIKTLEGSDVLARHSAIDALMRLNSDKAMEPIAKRLSEVQDRSKARKALEAMGPKAEAVVLKLANHADWSVRNEVCTILAVVGSEKSLPTLTKMQNDSHVVVRRSATQAVDAIQKRKTD